MQTNWKKKLSMLHTGRNAAPLKRRKYMECLLLTEHATAAATTKTTAASIIAFILRIRLVHHAIFATCIDGNWDLCYFIIVHLPTHVHMHTHTHWHWYTHMHIFYWHNGNVRRICKWSPFLCTAFHFRSSDEREK